MPEYSFLTTWCLEAPRERVWDAIWDSERWPQWWRGVVAAERLAEGDETGVGQVGRYTWRSRLPYDARLRDDAPPGSSSRTCSRARPRASWPGSGRWRLFEEDGAGDGPVTAVVYEWNVHTTKPWMNLLAPSRARSSPGTTTG